MSSRAPTQESAANFGAAEGGVGTRPPGERQPTRARRGRATSSLLAHGEPMVWLTGGGLALAILMIVGLLSLIVVQGFTTFWPKPLVQIRTIGGETYLGELSRTEAYEPDAAALDKLAPALKAAAIVALDKSNGSTQRQLLRTGNFELSQTHFRWIDDFAIESETRPAWGLVVERLSWGRFYGVPVAFLIDDKRVAHTPEKSWAAYREHHAEARRRYAERRRLETHDIGRINARLEAARLELRQAELDSGRDSDAWRQLLEAQKQVEAEAAKDGEAIRADIEALNRENDRYQIVLRTASGVEQSLALADIVRAYPANQLTTWGKLRVYGSRWSEFLFDGPREANSEGGIFPAIFGTVVMTLAMSLAVVPFGVLAALYMREYATAGPMLSLVRIAVNNLAGVPSIVFGVFGLGFFCYIIGGQVDNWFFPALLPKPTFGTGGLLWASLTLALLTLPVVIVATEEALAAVPRSMREGSYACGASKWQTIWRIVLPRALPGILTGMILAMARGAGEVAPLMLVGAANLAPELPVDTVFPFLHPQRSFMHMGLHIYGLGFQSPNSEAAKPLVSTTTLLLIAIIAALNFLAVWLRSRLRRRFQYSQF